MGLSVLAALPSSFGPAGRRANAVRGGDTSSARARRWFSACAAHCRPARRRRRWGQQPDPDCYDVVSGRHRVQAARQLMWTEIDAVIIAADVRRAELIEIDENLVRHDLTDAQRAKAHARREALMADMGLAHAGPGKPGNSAKSAELTSYAKGAASALGVSERTVRQDLARGKKIDPDVLADVQGTREDSGVVLDKLAAAPREEQPAQLALIRQQRADAEARRKAAECTNRDTDRVIALSAAQEFANWLSEHTPPSELNTIIAWLEGAKPRDVIAALRRAVA